jgi:membrane protein YqaA with SNARE-associated domain
MVVVQLTFQPALDDNPNNGRGNLMARGRHAPLHARMGAGFKKMLSLHILATATPTLARNFRRWVYHLGGLGFIPLGLIDSSVIPLPGSMDLLTIFLSARHKELWFYYAVMATGGSVLGGYVTYRLARKGGKETLARRFPPKKLEKVYSTFERWGLGAIAVPALLPPPMPMVPFLLAAGALHYPLRKFLFAFTLGRFARYTLLAYLAALYGRHILAFIAQRGHPTLWIVACLIFTTAAVLFFFFSGKRQPLPPGA